eukprot:6856493-Prymnesium_polylepis.2
MHISHAHVHVHAHGPHQPSCSRSIDTLVSLEHQLLFTARATSGQCGLMQSHPSCSARVWCKCGARTESQPRGRWCVGRRLSCDTDTRHDVSAGCSCRGRSVRRLQQHVGTVALAPPCGLLQPWMDGHVDSGNSHHVVFTASD